MPRQLSLIDRLITQADQALRTLVPNAAQAGQASPAEAKPFHPINDPEKKHIAGLMRVNHTGEVCAQALYQGQALTAKLPEVRQEMEQAAQQEIDHLVWCEQRIKQLDSHTSLLNPLFYAASFSLGAIAGIAGDKWSLGFVAATEDQVCRHLTEHLQQLPEDDEKTRAILEQMLADESEHGDRAMQAGGVEFSTTAKSLMTAVSKVMTKTSYTI